jgi:hypothetical protein
MLIARLRARYSRAAQGRFDPFAASVANDRSRESESSNAPSQPIWKIATAAAAARSWSRYDILARSKLPLSPRPGPGQFVFPRRAPRCGASAWSGRNRKGRLRMLRRRRRRAAVFECPLCRDYRQEAKSMSTGKNLGSRFTRMLSRARHRFNSSIL